MRWFWALVISTIFTQAVYNAVRVLMTYKALDLGGDLVFIGALTAAYSAIPLFVAFHAGRTVDKGHSLTVLWLGVSLSVMPVAVAAIATDLLQLLISNMLLGVGQSLSMVAAQGLVSQRFGNFDLNRRFGQLTLGVSIGQAIGMPLAGVLTSGLSESSVQPDVTIPLWGMFLVGACAVPFVAGIRPKEVRSRQEAKPSTAQDGFVQHEGPLLLMSHQGMKPAVFSSLAVLVAIDMLTAYLPLIAVANSISVAQVTALLTIRTLASVISRMFISPLLSISTPRRLLIMGTLLPAASMFLIPMTPQIWVLALLMIIIGFFFGLAQPLSMTWVSESVDTKNRAAALAMRMVGNRLGQVVIPLVAGSLSRFSGESSVFFLSSAILLSAASSTWKSKSRKRPIDDS